MLITRILGSGGSAAISRPTWAIILILLAIPEAFAHNVTTEDILRAWRERQTRVKTLTFAWKEQETYAEGALLRPTMSKSVNPKGLTVPSEDTTFESPKSLVIDGNKIRYTYQSRVWNDLTGQSAVQDYISVFDGETAKTFWPPGSVEHPRGVIKGEKHEDLNNIQLKPLLFHFRPLIPGFLGRTDSLRIVASDAVIRERPCIVVEESANASGGKKTYWLDPQTAFALVRYTSSLPDGRPVVQIDVTYRKDPTYGAIPDSWSIVWMNAEGKLKQSGRARVSQYAINMDVSAEEFDLKFPVGTWVTDMRKPSELGTFTDYLVKSEGERPVLKGDVGADYKQLLSSEPGMARRARYSVLGYVGGGLAVTACVVVVVALLRRRSRRVS